MRTGEKNFGSRNGGGIVLGLVSAVAVLWLSGCGQPDMPNASGYDTSTPYGAPVTPASVGPSRASRIDEARKPAEERPGLATGFGKRVKDEWQKKSFVRDGSKPKGTGMIFYNDREGVDAMTGYKHKVGPMQKAAGEMVEWGIRGRFGYLPSYQTPLYGSGSRRFVTGSAGSSYSIVVKNRCRSQVEVLLSVDGLDVIDGKSASFSKRGYVIAPGDTLEVKGWRTGWDSVARFEFSDVGGSYANQRHGDARNVGVIGLAVFGEKGVDPWKWMPGEVRTRATASPFAQAP